MERPKPHAVTSAAGVGHTRSGFVLAAVLLSMLLIAALLAAVFFVTTEETRAALASRDGENALAEAESRVLTAVDAIPADGQLPAVGETRSFGVADGAAAYATRLDSTLVWIVGEAHSGGSAKSAVRRIGVLASISVDSTGSIRVDQITDRGWSELF